MTVWHRRAAVTAFVAIAVTAGLVVTSGQQKAAPARQSSADALLGTGQYQEQVEGKLDAAIATYKKVLAAADATKAQKARAQLHIGLCYERLGMSEARKAYEAVVREYADQTEWAEAARGRLAVLDQGTPTNATAPTIRQVWKTWDNADYSQISPDGRSVAGVDEQTADLIVKDIPSGTVRRLTAIPKDRAWTDMAGSPVWSRDGRFIAYTWTSVGADARISSELRIADVQTAISRPRPITGSGSRKFSHVLDWAPDGKSILAATVQAGDSSLGWISLDGRFSELATATGVIGSGVVSHDSRWIAYSVSLSQSTGSASLGQSGIFMIPAARGVGIAVASSSIADKVVAWTPDDGALVLYGGTYEARGRLTLFKIVNGRPHAEPQLLRELVGRPMGLSNRGALLYSAHTPARRDVHVAAFDPTSGTLAGGGRRLNDPSSTNNTSPVWSPDGRRLAWIARDNFAGVDRNVRLSVGQVDTQTTMTSVVPVPARLAGITYWSMALRWTPDGTHVLLRNRDEQGQDALYRVNTTTGECRTVPPSGSAIMAPARPGGLNPLLLAWTPDGSTVYTQVRERDSGSTRPTSGAIVEHRLSDGAARELLRDKSLSREVPLALSPDGRWLAARIDTLDQGKAVRNFWIFPTEGGEPKVLPCTTGATIFHFSWAPDSRALVFTATSLRASGIPLEEAWLCSIDNGAPKKILTMDLMTEAVLSPDGRSIAYTGGVGGKDEGVWLMENFLPASKPGTKPTPSSRKTNALVRK